MIMWIFRVTRTGLREFWDVIVMVLMKEKVGFDEDMSFTFGNFEKFDDYDNLFGIIQWRFFPSPPSTYVFCEELGNFFQLIFSHNHMLFFSPRTMYNMFVIEMKDDVRRMIDWESLYDEERDFGGFEGILPWGGGGGGLNGVWYVGRERERERESIDN